MIEEFDHVRIKSSGITGIAVDIYTVHGETHYTVESVEAGVPGGYGPDDSYKLFNCMFNEIEQIG